MADHLYLGSGAGLPGFATLNTSPEADLCHDLRHDLPLPDRSVTAIFCDGQLELLDQGQGMRLLRECRRVLRADGILRIATPDLDHIVADYATCPASERGVRHPAAVLNQQLRGDGRQWLYNAQELLRATEMAGLRGAVLRGPADSAIAALAGQAAGGAGQLILECTPWKEALLPQPLVSIVIPAYRARFFGAALDSALAQTYPHTEILVLDDSANDDIRNIVAASPGAHRVQYLKNEPRLGEDRSLTRGVRLAAGQLIKPLYDDDILLPECVAQMVDGMLACPDAVMALSLRYTINADGGRIHAQTLAVAQGNAEVTGLSVAAFTLWSSGNYIGPPSAVMFRRDEALVTDVPNVMTFGGQLAPGAGDVALYLNLLGRGDVVFINEFLSEFRLHDDHASADPAMQHLGTLSLYQLQPHGRNMGLLLDDYNIKVKRML
jgi:predicted SAM-dependent methyltransferase